MLHVPGHAMGFNISLNALSRLGVKWSALAIVWKTLLLHSIVAAYAQPLHGALQPENLC